MTVKRTERGWAGHFICADRCMFRRNTLLEYGDIKVVVSTVGLMKDPRDGGQWSELGHKRYYETMAFHSDPNDTRYHDANVSRGEIRFKSPWSIDCLDADDKANLMHEMVVGELTERLEKGDPLPTCYEESPS